VVSKRKICLRHIPPLLQHAAPIRQASPRKKLVLNNLELIYCGQKATEPLAFVVKLERQPGAASAARATRGL
jgi:hypothetical protein